MHADDVRSVHVCYFRCAGTCLIAVRSGEHVGEKPLPRGAYEDREALADSSAVFEDLRVNHTCAEKLDIALTLTNRTALSAAHIAAYINLTAWFCEREVMWTEAKLAVIAVKLLHKHFKSTLKVRHFNALINNKAFNLVENRRMSSINSI